MHGLVNRAIQCFLRDTYGTALWAEVRCAAGAPLDGFEAMLRYPAATTHALLDAAALRLDRSRDSILEDIGTYLVSHPNTAALRRMLRFGGATFVDFLYSLEDLPGRGRLAVPDLDLPMLELDDRGDSLRLICRSAMPGTGHVMLGMLRALADDYGALALLEYGDDPALPAAASGTLGPSPTETAPGAPATEVVTIRLLDQRFSEGRRFHLSAVG